MHKSAIKFAIKHKINLGRWENGTYFISLWNDDERKAFGYHQMVSANESCLSALAMMRKYLQYVRKA